MTIRPRRKSACRLALPAAAILLTLGAGVQAASITPYAAWTVEATDNVDRVPANPRSDIVHHPVVGFDVDHQGGNFNANGTLRAEHYRYTQTDTESETYYNASGAANWLLWRQLLDWTLEDYAAMRPIDRTLPNSPANREQRNIFITGPSAHLRLGATNQMDLRARYGNFYYQRSDIDNHRYYGSILLTHRVSAITTVVGEYSATDTDFRSARYADYLRHDVRLGLERRLRNGMFTVDAGYTKILEQGAEDLDGNFFALVLDKDVSRTINLELVLRSELTDTGLSELGMGVVEVSPQSNLSVADAFATTSQDPLHDLFRQQRAELNVSRRMPDLRLTAGTWWHRERYRNLLTRDVTETGIHLGGDYVIGRNTGLSLHAQYLQDRYPNLAASEITDRDLDVGVDLRYRITPTLNLTLGISQFRRSSDDPLREYRERRGWVGLVYQGQRPDRQTRRRLRR